jgi:hypothetical protein
MIFHLNVRWGTLGFVLVEIIFWCLAACFLQLEGIYNLLVPGRLLPPDGRHIPETVEARMYAPVAYSTETPFDQVD